MLIPTEAIATALAISSAPANSSASARSSAPAGFSARQPPVSLGNPRIRPPGLRNPPSTVSTVPTGLPLAIPERMITRLPRKGGYPQTRGEVVTPPSDLPETSVSPTWASATVTGMFHTLQSVTIRPRRTPPDPACLLTGLPSAQMGPFRQDPLIFSPG